MSDTDCSIERPGQSRPRVPGCYDSFYLNAILAPLARTRQGRQIEARKGCQRLVCASWCGGLLGQLVQFWGYFFNRELSETRTYVRTYVRRYQSFVRRVPSERKTKTCFRQFPVEKITPKLHKLSQRTPTPGSAHQPLTYFACFDLAPGGCLKQKH